MFIWRIAELQKINNTFPKQILEMQCDKLKLKPDLNTRAQQQKIKICAFDNSYII